MTRKLKSSVAALAILSLAMAPAQYARMMAVFTPALNAFGFYEDGTEAGATAIAAQDTNITRNVDANSNLHIRVRIQETGGAAGLTTDDWVLQFSKNAGAYETVGTGGTTVVGHTTSGLVDESDTTQRLTAGTGSFVAGEQVEENISVASDRQLTASNFTEHVYAVTLRAADLANGDTLDFRILLNTSTFTYNVTPRITVSKSVKLYLRSTQANGIGATYYDMLTTAGASADTAVVNATLAGTQEQWTKTAGGAIAQWISPRVAAGGFTLESVSVSIWAKEDGLPTNCGGRLRVFRRESNGTETDLAGGPFDDGVEFTTSDAEYTWTGDPTNTAFVENDRILAKLYITNIGVMAIGTATLTFNAADAATGDSFINITPTVTFKAESAAVATFALNHLHKLHNA